MQIQSRISKKILYGSDEKWLSYFWFVESETL